MIQGSRGATLLVGMPGFVVGAQQLVDGEFVAASGDDRRCGGLFGMWQPGGGAWPICDVGAGSADLGPADGVGLVQAPLALSRNLLDASTWSETSAEIGPRAVMTERARRRLADMVNVDGDSIASAAGFFGVDGMLGTRRLLLPHRPGHRSRGTTRGSGGDRSGRETVPQRLTHPSDGVHDPDRRPGPAPTARRDPWPFQGRVGHLAQRSG